MSNSNNKDNMQDFVQKSSNEPEKGTENMEKDDMAVISTSNIPIQSLPQLPTTHDYNVPKSTENQLTSATEEVQQDESLIMKKTKSTKSKSRQEFINLVKAKSELVQLLKQIAVDELKIKKIEKEIAEVRLEEVMRDRERKEVVHRLKMRILEARRRRLHRNR